MLPSRWRCGTTVAGRSHFRAFWDESHFRLLPASHRAAAAARQINNFKEIAQTTMATLRGERGRLLQLATPQSMQQAKPKPCTSYKVVYISIGELHEWAWSGWRKKSTSCQRNWRLSFISVCQTYKCTHAMRRSNFVVSRKFLYLFWSKLFSCDRIDISQNKKNKK